MRFHFNSWKTIHSMVNRQLSDREVEILTLIANGYTNAQMARLLNLRYSTIATHRANIRMKLQVSNTAEMIRSAIHLGLIP